MNKIVMILATLVVTLFTANALAFNPPDAPADGTYVVDLAGKLTADQKLKLNQRIEQVNRATKNEFGILLLGTMGDSNIEDVAYDTFKKWGIGKRGLDNGCLIVVSIKERKSRIETGKGVGGDVPDITAKKILTENLNPHLKRGDFYGGFDDTLTALSSHIESRHAQKADPPPAKTATPTSPSTHRTNNGGCDVGLGSVGFGFGMLFLTGLIGVLAIGRWLSRKREEERQAEAERTRRNLERQRKIQADSERKQREAAEREREESRKQSLRRQESVWNLPTPPVAVPTVRPVPRPAVRASSPPPAKTFGPSDAVLAAGAALAAQEAEERRRRKLREDEERQAEQRRAREREEEDRRRRAREEEESRSRSSSSSSSSLFDWGGGSSGSGGGFGGFGGGDSGGGGSSSDW